MRHFGCFRYISDSLNEVIKQLRESSTKIISQAPLHGLWIEGRHYLPVDIDTTAMDNSKTKKEGVSLTYRKFDGFHPIFAYAGKVRQEVA